MKLKYKVISKLSVLLSIAIIISIVGPVTGNSVMADGTSVTVSFVQDVNGYAGTQNQMITSNDTNGDPNSDHFYLRDSGTGKVDLLLSFDLSSIPYNAVIDSASMDIGLYSYFTNPQLKLYPVKKYDSNGMWVDGQNKANWYQRGNEVPWTVSGSTVMDSVDKTNPVILTAPGGGAGALINTGDISSLVQSWINDPTSNQGWLLEPSLPGDDGSSWLFINGKDTTNPDGRPKLSITYHLDSTKTAPPTPTPSPTPTATPLPANYEAPQTPQTYIDTTYQEPTGGNLISVPEGGDLQAALDSAQPGDVIELQPGATYFGNFTLPEKQGNGWIYIKPAPSGYDKLPASGNRISPNDAFAGNMPKIITTGGRAAISTKGTAHNYRLVGLEITGTWVSSTTNQYGLVALGNSYETDVTKLAHDIVIDRCYIHGNTQGAYVRGVALGSVSTAVVDSYISEIHSTDADAQAILGASGPGPYKIVNNFLEASGENIMFGGSDPAIQGLVPSDIEIRGNYFYKPLTWRQYDPNYCGTRWLVKNLFELKNAQRVILDGNVLENSWTQGDQSGTALVLTPRNQGGNAPWCVVRDVAITNNIVKHVAHVSAPTSKNIS